MHVFKVLIGVLVFGSTVIAQEMAFYEWNAGLLGAKINGNTLIAGRSYVLGIDSKINDQRSSLLSQGLTEVVNTTTDYRLWYFPNNSFWKNTDQGGHDLSAVDINFGNGYHIYPYNNYPWIYAADGSFGSFYDVTNTTPQQKAPSFSPINYTQPTLYASEGIYSVQLTALGGFTIWNGSPSTRFENPVSLTTSINVVPEPSVISLLLAGGAVSFSVRRKRSPKNSI